MGIFNESRFLSGGAIRRCQAAGRIRIDGFRADSVGRDFYALRFGEMILMSTNFTSMDVAGDLSRTNLVSVSLSEAADGIVLHPGHIYQAVVEEVIDPKGHGTHIQIVPQLAAMGMGTTVGINAINSNNALVVIPVFVIYPMRVRRGFPFAELRFFG